METLIPKGEPPPYDRFDNPAAQSSDTFMPMVMPQPSAPPPSQNVNNITIGGGLRSSCNFGPKKQIANCPYCNVQCQTKVKSKALTKAHCWACIFFFIGFWPCICCPYCCCDCSKKLHYCGNCNAFLGVYDP